MKKNNLKNHVYHLDVSSVELGRQQSVEFSIHKDAEGNVYIDIVNAETGEVMLSIENADITE